MGQRLLTMDHVNEYLNNIVELILPGAGGRGIQYVYGPPRGGSVVAAMLSHRAPLTYLHHVPPLDMRRKTLWVDDIVGTGATLRKAGEQGWGRYAAVLGRPKMNIVSGYTIPDSMKDTWWVFPWETVASEILRKVDGTDHNKHPMDAADVVRQLIRTIGDDPARPGVRETPARVAKAYKELFGGYHDKVADYFKVFKEGANSMVAMCNIEFYSHCEHHIVPFYGRAHVAYVPQEGRVIGASKLARILDHYARRLQIQERVGEQVVAALMNEEHKLLPAGAACIIEARHMCMCARGVGKQHSTMMTSAIAGCFKAQEAGANPALAELYQLIELAKGQ